MSLSWRSIRSNPIALITAPLLCLIALMLSAYIYALEKNSRAQLTTGNTITIALNSGANRGFNPDTFNKDAREEDSVTIDTKEFQALLKNLESDANKDNFVLKEWLNSNRKAFNKSEYQQFLLTAARKTTQSERYPLANELFAEIGRKYFEDDLTGFYRAFALDKVDDYRLAKRTYEWQLERHPNHQSSAMNYGLLLLDNKQADEAIAALKHAINITSGKRKAKSLRFLARAYALKKNGADAIKTIRKAILFEPDSSQSWVLLADYLSAISQHDRQEVLDSYQKAIALDSKNFQRYFSLAKYQFSQLLFEDARDSFSEAQKRVKHKSELQLLASLNSFASGRPYSAQRILEGIDSDAGNKNALFKAAMELFDKDYQKAGEYLASIQKVISESTEAEQGLFSFLTYETLAKYSDPELKLPKYKISETSLYFYPVKLAKAHYLLAQDAAGLLEHSEQLAQSLPNSAEALLVYARSLKHMQQNQKALPVYAKAHNLQLNSRRIVIDYVSLLYEQDKNEQGMQILDGLLASQPRYTRALLLRAKILLKQQKMDDAERVLKAIITMDRNNIPARYKMAQMQFELGDHNEAILTLTDLLGINSADIAARILRTKILIASNRNKSALQETKRILKLDKNNKIALQLQEKLLAKSNKLNEDNINAQNQ